MDLKFGMVDLAIIPFPLPPAGFSPLLFKRIKLIIFIKTLPTTTLAEKTSHHEISLKQIDQAIEDIAYQPSTTYISIRTGLPWSIDGSQVYIHFKNRSDFAQEIIL